MSGTKWNVGCGRNILDGWVNIDSQKLPGVDRVVDLDEPLNILNERESTVDEFLLSHVIEHIRNPLPMMAALHHVALPNAKMTIRCPYGSSDDAFEDPTHVRQYFQGSFGYFSQPMYWRADYGYRGDWQVEKVTLLVRAEKVTTDVIQHIRTRRNMVEEMVCELRAIKPIREPRKELQVSFVTEVIVMP